MENEYFRPLIVNLTGKIRHYYKENNLLPANKLVIKPLLEKCISAYVYGIKKDSDLFKSNSDILINEKGKFKLDTLKECVIGHEYLWNATGWKRGSIIIILNHRQINWEEIFKNTYNPAYSDTPNSGNSISATKKCREESDKGNIAICFPASNGVEWMQIYANNIIFDEIMNIAEINCKRY